MITEATFDAGSIRLGPYPLRRDPLDTGRALRSARPAARAHDRGRRDRRPIDRTGAALFIDHFDEGIHGTLAPLHTPLAKEFGAHRVPREALAVWTVGGHRVIGVRDRDHRDFEWQFVSLEAARI